MNNKTVILESKVPCCVCGSKRWRKALFVAYDPLLQLLMQCAQYHFHVVCVRCVRDYYLHPVAAVRVAVKA